MSQTKTFKATIEVELSYDYHYDSEVGITILSNSLTSEGMLTIRKAIKEDALKTEVLERLADESAAQIPLWNEELIDVAKSS